MEKFVVKSKMSNKRLMALEKEVKQLKLEQEQQRQPVSQTGKSLLEYICTNEQSDYLITKEGVNPYKKERPCPVL